ncbi:DUF3099 domain-containing protein [Streptomyces sp. V4-01]|uniref:DUF3099 domain-containing protein n=1 Tax=Actinacidiphila polyblastidii TaxID=3110430 RepID=A0ABU7P7U0_9ACTN|nr:DUF3099 domain-containing protein [Streptomyces sp. V4-01]
MRKKGGREVFRITGARTGLAEDVRGRQRRYVISMAVRTLSVILTVVLWNVERPLAWATLVLGALLPYVAVVYANAGRENTPTLPTSTYIPPPARRALEPTSVQSAAEREEGALPAQDAAAPEDRDASGGAAHSASDRAFHSTAGPEAEAEPQAEPGASREHPAAEPRVEQPNAG